MRKAETILHIIRQRGEKRLPLNDLYRQLFNPDLYLQAYGKLYRNKGAMTPGSNNETVDAMSLEKINRIIEKVRYERYKWTSARRMYIPKKDGKNRPLGLPVWSDKMLQEVIRNLLESYYEPSFSDTSHGFRPGKGCTTALTTIKKVWGGTKWFIEGDIKGCFDNIDHDILINILKQDIQDNRFVRLISNLLRTGYMENGISSPTLSGTPQGSIVSPLLANIYLSKFDQYVEQEILPQYTAGKRRAHNPAYDRLYNQAYYCRKKGKVSEAKQYEQLLQKIPSNDTTDPDYRRLRYIRYADDFLLGFAGTKNEAEQIKNKLQMFLQSELNLQLSEQKTLITHASTQKARFLGYDLGTSICNSKQTNNRRSINGDICLRVPALFINDRCKFYMANGKPIHRKERTYDSDFSIISRYQAEYRGYVQYYQLAENMIWLNKLYWVMRTSLLKTLAHKHKSSVAKMARKFKSHVTTEYGPRTCLEIEIIREGKKPLLARFGGIPLKPNLKAIVKDQLLARQGLSRSELEQRLMANTCEICNATNHIEVHHIRKLSDVNQKGRKSKPDWVHLMAARKRKTLVLCRKCHDDLHAGRPLNYRTKVVTGEP